MITQLADEIGFNPSHPASIAQFLSLVSVVSIFVFKLIIKLIDEL